MGKFLQSKTGWSYIKWSEKVKSYSEIKHRNFGRHADPVVVRCRPCGGEIQTTDSGSIDFVTDIRTTMGVSVTGTHAKCK